LAPDARRHAAEDDMARCIDLFVDGPETLAGLAAELSDLAGVSFAEDPASGIWVSEQEGCTVELAEHDFVNDGQLALSSYRYDLSARVSPPDGQTSSAAILLRHALAAIKADGRYRALLVWDLQNVMDRAGEPTGAQQ
jgi:hypothetical protein